MTHAQALDLTDAVFKALTDAGCICVLIILVGYAWTRFSRLPSAGDMTRQFASDFGAILLAGATLVSLNHEAVANWFVRHSWIVFWIS